MLLVTVISIVCEILRVIIINKSVHCGQVPPITMKDFEAALPQVRPSVSEKDLDVYINWNKTYGSFGQPDT